MKEAVKRFKTPKLTKDWYIKWASSIVIQFAMSLRSTGEFPFADMVLSFIGCAGWISIGIMWKDKAIMVVHVGAFISLLIGYLNA